jgi:hypothetical protein
MRNLGVLNKLRLIKKKLNNKKKHLVGGFALRRATTILL